MIVAEKNGQRRTFSQSKWDALGTDKYGWVIVPGEVVSSATDIVVGQDFNASQTVNKTQKRRKK